MDINDIDDLKSRIEIAKNNVSSLEGQKKSEMQQLARLGVNSEEEAEEVIEKNTQKLVSLKSDMDRMIVSIEEKYSDLLEKI